MTPFNIVLLVVFIVVMLLWLLAMLGVAAAAGTYSGWLAFFACACLGTAVFFKGT